MILPAKRGRKVPAIPKVGDEIYVPTEVASWELGIGGRSEVTKVCKVGNAVWVGVKGHPFSWKWSFLRKIQGELCASFGERRAYIIVCSNMTLMREMLKPWSYLS